MEKQAVITKMEANSYQVLFEDGVRHFTDINEALNFISYYLDPS